MLETLEDLEKLLPDEAACISFLWKIRDSVWTVCNKCGGDKIYKNSDGKTRKCAKCRTGISVTQWSFIDNAKLPLKDLLSYIFLYGKTKGRFSVRSLNKHLFITAYMTDDKLKRLYYNLDKIDATMEWMFIEACKNIYQLGKSDLKRKHFASGFVIDPNEVIDLRDKEVYSRVCFFAERQMHAALYKKWILEIFIEPAELIAETIIFLAEAGTTIITGQILVEALRKTQNKLYTEWIKANPKIERYYRVYKKQWKEKCRRNLRDPYIKDLIQTASRNKGEWKTERTFDEWQTVIKEKREQLREKRDKRGYATGIDFDLYS
jgi:hypothetical protein